MGVPGLWDILRPVGEVRSLTHLAVTSGFVDNTHGHRAYRIGIDASIWFFHAQGGREGENPELRTLFFRCSRLLAMPFLPIFVFDGPKRPKMKRGKAIGGKQHWMVNSLRVVLDAFGFECRTAPGEAEAELAYLNRIGVIDAVLSDDVDCFLFGALTVIRNSSATLSGNRGRGARNADGKEDGQHVHIFRSEDIKTNPAVTLSPGGLILIALLRGGDYDQHGIDGCGLSTAVALARAGFGDTLLNATHSPNPEALTAFLPTWRTALRHELRTNASGLAPRKSPILAQRITDDFPRLDVLRCYTHPVTSESDGMGTSGLHALWEKRVDVAKIAHVCEMFFEWGVEQTVVKRFRSFLWPGAVLRILLQLVLEQDKPKGGGVAETPTKTLSRTLGGMKLGTDSDEGGEDDFELITAIHGERRHASTDHILEYRLEIDPRQLVSRARSGIQGLRTELKDSAAAEMPGEDDYDEEVEDEAGKKGCGQMKTPSADPDSKLRIWMPAVMVRQAYPDLVEDYLERVATKDTKKGRGEKEAVRVRRGAEEEEEQEEGTPRTPVKAKMTKPKKVRKPNVSEVNLEECEGPNSVTVARPKFKPKPAGKKANALQTEPVASTSAATDCSSSQSSKFKSMVQLLDEDPFLVTTSSANTLEKSSCKTAVDLNSRPGAGKSLTGTSKRHCVPVPRPFPLAVEASNSFNEHSSRSSSSDVEITTGVLEKSPRRAPEHVSPRKKAPTRRPRERSSAPRVIPLQLAAAARSASVGKTDDEVIVISSDSDVPPAKVKAKKPLISDDCHVIDLT